MCLCVFGPPAEGEELLVLAHHSPWASMVDLDVSDRFRQRVLALGLVEGGDCADGDAEDVRAPRFVRLDVQGKKIEILEAGGEGEVTTVDRVVRSEGRLILQGVEGGRGWSFLVSEETGETTLSVSDDGGAFVTFGACTAL